jgi:hypothetical protein
MKDIMTLPITLAVAADDLEVSVKTLYWHINIKKDLQAFKLGSLTVIDPEVWAKLRFSSAVAEKRTTGKQWKLGVQGGGK